ncbi:alkene reductase [Zymobacter sp. IVIA_12111.31 C1]|uniref:alkene reductase n=1 Tax=Zymobacter sp. IVIA_12111.31 C1 TaxID=3394854 RepID=UPI0039C38118
MTSALFTPAKLGRHTLANRIFLPPLTRCRSSQPEDIPNALMATYYRQRASAGFMVTEGTVIEPRGRGYAWTPGIYTPEQVSGWRKTTDAVHAAGGVIFCQLWHVGRVSHPALQPNGEAPVAPSALQAKSVKVFIPTGEGTGELVQPGLPRALSVEEIKEIVQLYATAARNAIDAGFDGVEIHSANGYLPNQFLSMHTNQRQDEYGGSLSNRLRFLKEIVEAVAEAIGAERVGVRFAPLFTSTDDTDRTYLGLVEDNPHETYLAAVSMLENAGVAYVSIAEADWDDAPEMPESFRQAMRSAFSGAILYAGKYTAEKARRIVDAGLGDLIGFGRPFIANPDLPARLAHDWPLNPLDAATMYGGTDKGYTDYPLYQAPTADDA